MKFVLAIFVALAGSAAAFAPRPNVASRLTSIQSRFEDKVWDIDSKVEIYNEWNPAAPRSVDNFNPFEKNDDGNSCDTNGYYPGEGKYKDPIRPDTNFAIMNKERETMEAILASPKPGQPGPGNYQGFNKM